MNREMSSTSRIVWSVMMVNIQRMMSRAVRSIAASSEAQTRVH